MKCHYEILEVAREATTTEIKSSYRKLALKWHPDKNLDNSEYAKEQFQLVQQAYEILSDPQERAWYDRHREQILHGPSSEFEHDSLDLFQFFTTTCFKGYGDDENGFYTVYNNVFKQIMEEDMEFINDKQEFLDIPQFGNSQSDYESVVSRFYAYWLNYQTKKSFVWLDTYDITETKDRRLIKLMEKENKKIRQKAKKEYNEEVRNLVAFVRKRDERVQEYTKLMEMKSLKNRQKLDEYRKQKKIERLKELEENQRIESDWMKFDNVKSELEDIEKHLNEQFGDDNTDIDSDNDDLDNDLYCVACNKLFKTPKSFQNHESSKKHKEAVELIKTLMTNDDDNSLNDDEDEYSSEEDYVEETKKPKKQKKSKVLRIDTHDSDDADLNEISDEKPTDKPSNDKHLMTNNDNNYSSDEDYVEEKKKPKKQKKSKILRIDTHNSDDADLNEINDKKPPDSNEDNANTITNSRTKIKKNKKPKNATNELPTNNPNSCLTCNSNFPSKNRLFNHLKSTGHGVPIPTKKERKKK